MPKFPRLVVVLSVLAGVVVLIVGGCVSSCVSAPARKVQLQQAQCARNLRAIGQAILQYQTDNEGRRPPTLATLLDSEFIPASVASCPGSATTTTQPGHPVGYVFIDWSNRSPAVDDGGYPVMYDCSLENHHGSGINILMLDGSVRWDPGAAWLRQFASQHPEFSIALPD